MDNRFCRYTMFYMIFIENVGPLESDRSSDELQPLFISDDGPSLSGRKFE